MKGDFEKRLFLSPQTLHKCQRPEIRYLNLNRISREWRYYMEGKAAKCFL